MSKLSVLIPLIALLLLSACTPELDLAAEKAKVKIVVDQLEEAFESEDIDLYGSIIAKDPDMVNLGTDVGERIVGWETLMEQYRQQNASYENTELTVSDQVIKLNATGNTAWFSEIVDWEVDSQGEHFSVKGSRLTGVLEKRDGKWLVVQMHTSVPVSGQAAAY